MQRLLALSQMRAEPAAPQSESEAQPHDWLARQRAPLAEVGQRPGSVSVQSTQVLVVPSQIRPPAQSALLMHWMQMRAVVSQIGVMPAQSALPTQPAQLPLATSQVAAAPVHALWWLAEH
jgi:hypothetical protein